MTNSSGGTIHRYAYGYDPAGNRTTQQTDLSVSTGSFNNLNQLQNTTGGGALRFSGTVNQNSNVTLNGVPATQSSPTQFTGQVGTTTGTNVVTVVAQNTTGLATTNQYQVVTAPGNVETLGYDLNGNETSDAGHTYEWDSANRLTAINYTSNGNRTEFTYDGLGRRIKIVEKAYDHAASTKQFVFVDKNIAEERNATGTVTKQFYPQGVSILSGYSTTGNFYYTRDHLGSVRELLSDAGTIVSRLNYDPYGRTTLVSGTNLSDFQYAGMYMHQTSGLNLTLYRAYDPNTARWLSRDPLGKEAGSNLYGYVANNPIIATDPLGLILHIVGDPTNILQNLQKILKGKVSVDKDGNVQRSPCSQDQDFDRRVDQLINSKTVYNIRDQEDPNHFQRPDSYDPNTHTIEVNDSTYTYPDGVWNPFSEAVGDEASALGHELMRAYANDNGEPQDDSDTARQNVVNRANPAYTRQGLPPRTGY